MGTDTVRREEQALRKSRKGEMSSNAQNSEGTGADVIEGGREGLQSHTEVRGNKTNPLDDSESQRGLCRSGGQLVRRIQGQLSLHNTEMLHKLPQYGCIGFNSANKCWCLEKMRAPG